MPVAEPRFVRTSDVIYSEIADGHAVLLSIEGGRYYSLNPTAVMVWAKLEHPSSVGALCEALLASFEVNTDDAQRDVQTLIADLKGSGLVHQVSA